MPSIDQIFQFFKLPQKVFVLIWIVSTILLLTPERILSFFQLASVYEEYGKWIGIISLVSFVYVLILLFLIIQKKCRGVMNKRKQKKIAVDSLSSLTYSEKCVLREFVIQGKDVIQALREDNDVVSLLNKKIIYYASSSYMKTIYGCIVWISISPYVKKFQNDKFYGFEFDSSKSEEEVKKLVLEERPAFVKIIESINDMRKPVSLNLPWWKG